MKMYLFMFAMMATGVLSVNAQTEFDNDSVVTVNETSEEMQEDLQQVLNPTFGDYYEGLTKKITFDRMIPPYGLEVTFDNREPFLPNDTYEVTDTSFRLYFRSLSEDAHNIEVIFFDSFGKEFPLLSRLIMSKRKWKKILNSNR